MRLAKWRPITATDCHICLPPLLPGNKTFRLLARCHDPRNVCLSSPYTLSPCSPVPSSQCNHICRIRNLSAVAIDFGVPSCISCDRVCWQLPNLTDEAGSCVCVCLCVPQSGARLAPRTVHTFTRTPRRKGATN